MAYAVCSGEQVTTVGLESALVREDLNGCAFVYGSLSFLDKMSCGIALFVLESYEGNHDISMGALCVLLLESSATGWGYVKPCPFFWFADTIACGETRGLNTASRYGTGLVPSCFAVLALVVTSTLRLDDDAPIRAAALEAPLLV
jgi:hypothetical protein